MPDTPVTCTSLDALFKDMQRVADEHPTWHFESLDDQGNGPQGPLIGWIAFPPKQPHLWTRWTIRLSDVRMQAQKLDAHWQEAIRTPENRGSTLIRMVTGRSAKPPPARPSRYDILMAED